MKIVINTRKRLRKKLIKFQLAGQASHYALVIFFFIFMQKLIGFIIFNTVHTRVICFYSKIKWLLVYHAKTYVKSCGKFEFESKRTTLKTNTYTNSQINKHSQTNRCKCAREVLHTHKLSTKNSNADFRLRLIPQNNQLYFIRREKYEHQENGEKRTK